MSHSFHEGRMFAGGHLTQSQCRKLSTLRHKRTNEPKSIETLQHHHNQHYSRSTRKNQTLEASPYRTFERSERKLHTLHKPRTDDRSNNSSHRKIQTKSLSTNAKLNFRLRVYSNPFARRFTKEQLKPQQMNTESATVYEKLFRRKKYGLETNKLMVHPVPSTGKQPATVAAAVPPQVVDSEEDEISRNYIRNEIFMFQNESLEFGYDEEPTSKPAPPAKKPSKELTTQPSSEKKKNFRRGKYDVAPPAADLQTIEQSGSPSARGGRQSILDEAILVREDLADEPPLLKRTIESQQSEVHA